MALVLEARPKLVQLRCCSVRALDHRPIFLVTLRIEISPRYCNLSPKRVKTTRGATPLIVADQRPLIDGRVRPRRRVARSPDRPWASNARCQVSSSSSESAYRRQASSIVMAPLRSAARTAALRRATHLSVVAGGRSAIDRGCPLAPAYERHPPDRARLPIGPRHLPPGEP